jgi:hypothetical protein
MQSERLRRDAADPQLHALNFDLNENSVCSVLLAGKIRQRFESLLNDNPRLLTSPLVEELKEVAFLRTRSGELARPRIARARPGTSETHVRSNYSMRGESGATRGVCSMGGAIIDESGVYQVRPGWRAGPRKFPKV